MGKIICCRLALVLPEDREEAPEPQVVQQDKQTRAISITQKLCNQCLNASIGRTRYSMIVEGWNDAPKKVQSQGSRRSITFWLYRGCNLLHLRVAP
jgi:cytochrome c-type biogenesis protein CcmH/NrfF